ncbi:MAG: glycosyltransferase family 39 protein, partial [Chloroflexi bacterium]|nr:glycosyltransferase family 39 protein [Chloroflexota bacterium]
WWRALAGGNDVLARLFSVLPGTLTIPLAFAIARRLWDRSTAERAALLVAVAPLTLFYSREARMYALAACLAMALLWLFLRQLQRPRGAAWWVAYGVTGAAAAYVHYLGALAVFALLVAAIVLRRRAPHVTPPVVASTALITLLVVPWALRSNGLHASLPALSPAHLGAVPAALVQAWQDLAAGPDSTGVFAAASGFGLLLLVALGAPRNGSAAAVVWLSLAAGLFGFVFALLLGKPVQARYLLPIAPLIYLCAAAGLGRLRNPTLPPSFVPSAGSGQALRPSSSRLAAAIGAAALLAGLLPFWMQYYSGYARADYSAITRRIAALERPGDTVLLTGPWQAWYYDYYYRGKLFHTVLPKDVPPALETAQARPTLDDLTQRHRRLWFVQAGLQQADPANFVERWLQRNAWPALRDPYQTAVLSMYALHAPANTRPLRPASFGDAVRLTGGWVDADEVPSGEIVRLTLEFETVQPTPANYKASLRLAGADGQRLSTDFDLVDRAGDGEAPTSQWKPGQPVAIRRGIWVPPGTGVQPYEVRLVVYGPATLAPLPADDGNSLAEAAAAEAVVGKVSVTQSLADLRPGAVDAGERLERRFGGTGEPTPISLAGIRWVQQNPSRAPLTLDLFWRAEVSSVVAYQSVLTVEDARGRRWIDDERPLFGATFDAQDWFSHWREHQTLAERRSLDVSSLPRGRYRLVLSLQESGGRTLPVDGTPGTVELLRFDIPYRRPVVERAAGLLSRIWQR